MRNNFKPFILFALIILMAISCEEEKAEIDPSVAILGKWEIIELGGFSIIPTGYSEYLLDSVLKEFVYESEAVAIRKYWIDDSILYHLSVFEGNDSIGHRYKYNFSDNNTLRLEKQALATFRTATYKRIK
jgi:hypothetical protein